MPDLVSALLANPLVPTPYCNRNCELCQLRWTHPDVYAWVTRAVFGAGDGGALTQAEIAAEVERRTGLSITQSQVSNHKTKHLDASLEDAIETMLGHTVLLDYLAGMEPAEMAVAYTKLALAKTGKMLDEAEDPKAVSSLGGTTAALARVLQDADEAVANATLAEIEARLAELKEQHETEDFALQLANWVRQHYPDLEPVLADPEKLQALLAAVRAGAGNA